MPAPACPLPRHPSFCGRQSGRVGDVAHLGLPHLAEGEERVAELLLRELEEEIRLVLGAVDGLAQLERAVAGARDPRVVAGSDLLRADGLRLLVKEVEL